MELELEEIDRLKFLVKACAWSVLAEKENQLIAFHKSIKS